MDHGPAVQLGKDNAADKKAKLGVWMFILYSAFYVVFVGIAVGSDTMMSEIVFAGQNLAVVYGFSLIVFAIILGIIYNAICTGYENKMNKEEEL
ncbi:MAG: DUF485 domain-containing protein [Candidatus Kapabacteria bacterium]|jgi:uncharacterized membrane protein (DUF485 family)|nr:DUF485 domain-containing protein [Candidatus Kapabacteria bacterium]